MKTKTIFFVAVLGLVFSTSTMAQMDECLTTTSLFYEPAKVKNYEAALPHYGKVIQECPQYNLATYQYGVKMFKHFIKGGDKSKITDLEKAYQMRIQYYPSKSKIGDIYSDIAQIKYDNGIGTKMQQFQEFDAAFAKDAETFKSPKRIYTYFSLAKDLYESGEKDIQEVFDLYDVIVAKINKEEAYYAGKLTALLDKQEAGTTLSKKEAKRLKGYEKNLGAYGKIRGSVDGKLGSIADCENLIPLYEKNFEAKKNDVKWLKGAAGRLNAKDCDTPLFYQMVQQLHSLQPSAASAFYLGRLAEKDGNSADALDYYNQAVELETNPDQKVKYYRSIAENFRKKRNYGKARTYYRKLLELKPNDGNSYLKIAQMYAKSSDGCADNVFDKRAINWLAAQMADKAARVDPSIAKTARAAASSYRQRAPTKTEIFSAGKAGTSVSFKCWVGGSVKVPSL